MWKFANWKEFYLIWHNFSVKWTASIPIKRNTVLFWRRICEKLQIDRSWMWFDINFLSNQLFLFISCFEVGTRPSFFVWWRVRRSRVSLHCPKWTFPRMQDFGPESPKILSFQGLISMIFDFLLPKPVESFSRHASEVGNSLKWLVLDVRREKSWNVYSSLLELRNSSKWHFEKPKIFISQLTDLKEVLNRREKLSESGGIKKLIYFFTEFWVMVKIFCQMSCFNPYQEELCVVLT